MTFEREKRISKVFLSACDVSDERRSAFLDAACCEDVDLRAEVESLLEYHDPSSVIEPVRGEANLDHSSGEEPIESLPDRIGRYHITALLGRGGFGVVYRARDDELHRQIAIKVPHARLVERPQDADVYVAEARTVANLDHPHIVPVYDVGHDDRFHSSSFRSSSRELRWRRFSASLECPGPSQQS